MKKTMKNLFAIILAVMMCLSLTVVAFAKQVNVETPEGGFTITINTTVKNPGTFTAYQVFKGDLSKDDEAEAGAPLTLSNIEWGSAILPEDVEDLMTAILGCDNAFQTYQKDEDAEPRPCATAAEVAEVLAKNGPDSKVAQSFADAVSGYLNGVGTESGTAVEGKVTFKVSEPGYYLVKSNKPENTEGYAATRYILGVVGDTTVTEKADIPEVEKKVMDKNDSNNGDPTNGWGDTADWDINDEVPFQLTGSLPTNYDKYDNYSYTFHDTLSEGLTYNEDSSSLKVYVDNEGTRTEVPAENYVVSASTDPVTGQTTLTVTFSDLKSVKGDDISITSESKIVVEYTATLNEKAKVGNPGNPNEVYLEYSNNPNAGGEGETGTTPPDKVVVFTYELDVDKVNQEEQPLTGAGFTLSKKTSTDEDGNPVYTPINFKPVEDADGNVKYVVTTETPNGENGVVTELKGEDMTKFVFAGLDDGEYKLEETTTPPGYNTITPIEFTVTAVISESNPLELGSVTFKAAEGSAAEITSGTGEEGKGAIGVGAATIVNRQGSQLPSTGGIGTTIFTIVGIVLIIGAGVLLITKKRMAHQDD